MRLRCGGCIPAAVGSRNALRQSCSGVAVLCGLRLLCCVGCGCCVVWAACCVVWAEMCFKIFMFFHFSFLHSAAIQRSFNIDISTRTVILFTSRRMSLYVSQFHRVTPVHERGGKCIPAAVGSCDALRQSCSGVAVLCGLRLLRAVLHAMRLRACPQLGSCCCVMWAVLLFKILISHHFFHLSFKGVPANFCWRTPPVGPTFPAAPGTLKTVHGRESCYPGPSPAISAVNLSSRELQRGLESWRVSLLCCGAL